MSVCDHIQEALDGLAEASTEFDGIEQDLEELKTKLEFFAEFDSIPPDEAEQALETCESGITTREKKINRHISHFNKALQREKSVANINFGEAPEDVLRCVDEMVRKHLRDTGYATVASCMHDESPTMVSSDIRLAAFRLERVMNRILYDVTDGDAGFLTDSQTGAIDFGERQYSHQANGLQKDRSRSRSRSSSSSSKSSMSLDTVDPQHQQDPLVQAQTWKRGSEFTEAQMKTIFDLEQLLVNAEHSKDESWPFVSAQYMANMKVMSALPHFQIEIPQRYIDLKDSLLEAKRVEYRFLRNLRDGGVEAALQFLKSESIKLKNELEDKNILKLITKLSGRLVTSKSETLDRELMVLLLDMRAELCEFIRTIEMPVQSSTRWHSSLEKTAYIGSYAMQKYTVPLQSARFFDVELGDELPVEIELDEDDHAHAIFVCPIMKRAAMTDEVSVLPCGHLLSEEAVDRLLDMEYKSVQCPYCFKVYNYEDVAEGRLFKSY